MLTTDMGEYQYNVIPVGLHNAPETFQCAFFIILSCVRCQVSLLYHYDVTVFSPNIKAHCVHMYHILEFIKSVEVSLKLNKVYLFNLKVYSIVHKIISVK